MDDMTFPQHLWNRRDLEAPPVTTYVVFTKIDISRFCERFREAINFFNNQNQLEIEAAFLSKSVFRMKQKFRCDKGFKCMQKLNKALHNYFEINFVGLIENFYGLLPKTVNTGLHLPTKNMLDFILVKLQGLVVLLSRIIETAKIGAHAMEERIAIGHLWRLSFVMYAMLSRICYICERIVDFSCQFYKDILPMRAVIGNVSTSWLSDSYKFPANLQHWLNVDHLEDINTTNKLHNNSFSTVYEIDEQSDVEFLSDDATEIAVEAMPIIQEPRSKSAFERLLDGEDDVMLQEVLSEDSSQHKAGPPLQKKKNKRKKRRKQNKEASDDITAISLVDSIQTMAALKNFISKEAELRQSDKQNSVFSHMDSLQWNMVQNCLKKIMRKGVRDALNQGKVDEYLIRAREVLKSNLDN